ncbi:MAG TPA: hypothetical protein VF434_10550, partial [Promineifilum sp.]
NGDTNDKHDVFVHDRFTGETERVSVASDGKQGNDTSWGPSISADGRIVAFSSAANLGAQPQATWNIFVHDRITGETTLVSISSDGTPANESSMTQPAISASGHIIAFESEATNLVAGDLNNVADIFIHDLQSGETTRVSVASDGTEANNYSSAPALSADGRYVAFASGASNLFANDTNGVYDVFIHDRQTGETTLISTRLEGVGISQDAHLPAVSADGRRVAFMSRSSDLVTGDTGDADIFVYDRMTGTLDLVSVGSNGEKGNGDSDRLAISADGLRIAFDSRAANLVPGDTNDAGDVFVHNLVTGETSRVSVGDNGDQGNGSSFAVGISPDGLVVGFASDASNLVLNDTNNEDDVFLRIEFLEAARMYLPMTR